MVSGAVVIATGGSANARFRELKNLWPVAMPKIAAPLGDGVPVSVRGNLEWLRTAVDHEPHRRAFWHDRGLVWSAQLGTSQRAMHTSVINIALLSIVPFVAVLFERR